MDRLVVGKERERRDLIKKDFLSLNLNIWLSFLHGLKSLVFTATNAFTFISNNYDRIRVLLKERAIEFVDGGVCCSLYRAVVGL